MQAGKLMVRPYIPLLKEHNVRKGFFERSQSESAQRHLPEHMHGIAAFAFVTDWRAPSEILPLEWRQVDLKAGEVRLDVSATKNGEERVFPVTTELRRILDNQQKIARRDRLSTWSLVPQGQHLKLEDGARAGATSQGQ